MKNMIGDGIMAANYSEQQWLDWIAQMESSELSNAEWCRQHGLNDATAYGWKRRLKQKGIFPKPAPSNAISAESDEITWVKATGDTAAIRQIAPMPNASAFRIKLNGVTIAVPENYDDAELSRIIRVVRDS